MKNIGKLIIKNYSRFVAENPFKILLIVLLITFVSIILAGNVETKSLDNEDMVPGEIDVIRAFDIIGNDFGQRDSIMISVEVDQSTLGGPRDLRKPEIVKYINDLSLLALEIRDVDDVDSLSTLLKLQNDGRIPRSERKIKDLINENELYSNYISDDYTHSLIRLSLGTDFDDKEIVDKLQNLVDNVNKPVQLKVSPAGMIATGPVIEGELGPDMQRTSIFSIVGILVVLFLLFGSPRYALTPLSVIIIGVIWAYGYFGLIGVEISPATTGAISMIMGIGIDFGIQTVMRFRHELKKKGPSEAMEETLRRVFLPMFTTTLAALIGFRAMSMGDLTIMEELGDIMSYGVTACFLAAITVVPAVTIIGEKFKFRKNKGRQRNDKRK